MPPGMWERLFLKSTHRFCVSRHAISTFRLCLRTRWFSLAVPHNGMKWTCWKCSDWAENVDRSFSGLRLKPCPYFKSGHENAWNLFLFDHWSTKVGARSGRQIILYESIASLVCTARIRLLKFVLHPLYKNYFHCCRTSIRFHDTEGVDPTPPWLNQLPPKCDGYGAHTSWWLLTQSVHWVSRLLSTSATVGIIASQLTR